MRVSSLKRSPEGLGESTPPSKRKRGDIFAQFGDVETPEEKEEKDVEKTHDAENPGGGDLVTRDAGECVASDAPPIRDAEHAPKDDPPIDDKKKNDSEIQVDLISAVKSAGLEVSVRAPSNVVEGLQDDNSEDWKS